jgi:hypothetical protein
MLTNDYIVRFCLKKFQKITPHVIVAYQNKSVMTNSKKSYHNDLAIGKAVKNMHEQNLACMCILLSMDLSKMQSHSLIPIL